MSAASQQLARVDAALTAARSALRSASDVESLRRVANEHTGKTSELATLKASIGSIADVDAKRSVGRAINEALQAIDADVQSRIVIRVAKKTTALPLGLVRQSIKVSD